MPIDVSVEGTDRIEALGRRLKEVGDKQLRKELSAGLNRATKPLKLAIKKSALETLPKKGGLNQFVAKSKITTKTKLTGRNPGVSIVAKLAGHDVRAIDRGKVRHPVFGNRKAWVNQDVPEGFFTKPMKAGGPSARREILSVFGAIEEALTDG